ncbi:MAG: Veg family protein [Clostridia bacterium]|nr:Veg family protein [Clostridia bacterium]
MKTQLSWEQAKEYVTSLVGKRVDVKYNKGRNKYQKFFGVVEKAYPNVFTLNCQENLGHNLTCAYSDVVCGNVQLLTSNKA